MPNPEFLSLAQRKNLSVIGTPVAEELPMILDRLSEPSTRAWFDFASDYLTHPDIDSRILVTDRLPDVITEKRKASLSTNTASHVLGLYEEILGTQPSEIISAAARWTGLFILRSQFANSDDHSERIVGEDRWPLRPWFYQASKTRAIAVTNALLGHDDITVRERAQLSKTYWQRWA